MKDDVAGKPWIPEWAAMLTITLAASVLRLMNLAHLGIDHFDEGIYVAAGGWSVRPAGLSGIDPGLIPYAPPGYPTLVGVAYILLGQSDFAAVSVSILAGVATIPLIGTVGRRTLGAGGGVGAATFAAFSGIHIVFSRMALTDATFLLVWIGGVALGGRFLDRPGALRAIALGVVVGLAQTVKYNGWLIGAIVGATAVVGALASREERTGPRLARTFGWGLVAAVVAGVVSWPWFHFVERHGGYIALITHQRSYLGEPSDWTRHLMIQLQQVGALGWSGFSGSVAFLMAFASRWLIAPKGRLSRLRFGQVFVVLLAAILFGPATSGWWLGLGLVPWIILDPSPRVRLLAVWWVALTVLTPLYHPYARLWLPLEAAGWMFQAMVVVSLARRLGTADESAHGRVRTPASVIVLALLAAAVQSFGLNGGETILNGTLGPRDSFRVGVSRILAALPTDVRSIRLLGRPTLGYYVRSPLSARRVESRTIESLSGLEGAEPGSWAIVDLAQLHQEGGIPAGRMQLARAWTIVAEEPTILSPATLLDIDPGAAAGDRSARLAPLLLIRRNPPGAKP